MSKKAKYYRQCRLRKKVREDSHRELVSWLPDRYAIEGKWLKLKNERGEWEDHWLVISVGGQQTAEVAEERARDYKKWRETTDI